MGESSSGRDVESETMVVMVGNSPQGEAGPKLWDTIRLCRLFFPWNCYQRIIKPLKWALLAGQAANGVSFCLRISAFYVERIKCLPLSSQERLVFNKIRTSSRKEMESILNLKLNLIR